MFPSLPPFSYSFNYDGSELHSIVIFCSIQEISIRLLNPYEGIETCLHTPNFAMHPSRHNLDRNNGLTEKGISNIRLCMIRAYIKSRILTDNLPLLMPLVTSAMAKISELEAVTEQSLISLRNQKRIMKAGLKAGSISKKDYTEVLNQIRSIECELKSQISQIQLKVLYIPELVSVMNHGDEYQLFDFMLKSQELS